MIATGRVTRTAGVVVALTAGMIVGCNRSGTKPADTTTASAGGAMTVSDIMQKVNKRKGGLHGDLGAALKADPIEWTAVQPQAKEYAALAESLGKNEPPTGDKSSWETLTKSYADNAKALAAATDGKDQTAAQAAHSKLSRSCKACHDAHKP